MTCRDGRGRASTARRPRARTLLVGIGLCLWLGANGEARAQQNEPPPTPPPAASEPPPEGDAGDAPAPGPTHTPATPRYGAVATATRSLRPPERVAATVSTLERREIDTTPALTPDVLIRSLPSLATFRASTSLTADPTSQGLNVRGVGPSGVSRSLVLVDGVPANDPFGGWLYWRALPQLDLAGVELMHGGASALYGSAALAGVLQMRTRSPFDEGYDLDLAYGSYQTVLGRGRAAVAGERTALALTASVLDTAGYPTVPASQRGPVDGPADSLDGSLRARVEAHPSKRVTVEASLGAFAQRLHGTTELTTSDVRTADASVATTLRLAGDGRLRLSVYARAVEFEQGRPRIDEDRSQETLARQQRVPAGDGGASLLYAAPGLRWGGEHDLSAGLDVRQLRGEARERLYPTSEAPPDARVRNVAGGRQWFVGAFAQDLYRPIAPLQLEAALRADLVRTSHGHVTRTRRDGSIERQNPDDSLALELSPRAGLVARVLPWLALRGSVYRAFRAPTLNESYRAFEVGGVVTAANASLRPEHLTGVDAGVSVDAFGERLRGSAVGYWNRLEDPIVNATLPAPLPDGATRQRQNLGEAQVRGVELGLEGRLHTHLDAFARYTLAASEVTASPGRPRVVGKRLPHAALHRTSFGLTFDDPRLFTLSVRWRYLSARFEDDLNTDVLPGFHVVDAELRRHVTWHLWAFAAVENLLNARYIVGTGNVDTLGPPLMGRVGLSIRQGRD